MRISISIGRRVYSVSASLRASVERVSSVASRSSSTSSKEQAVPKMVIKQQYKVVKPYGIFSFLFDVIMVTITGGLWLIWIFAREMRKR